MTASLPSHPSIEHLKKQAKQLLAAQRNGMVQCCQLLRRINRFSEATDEEILAAHVTLAETQFIVALHYGFESWAKLRAEVRTRPIQDVNSLEAVIQRCGEEIPDYAGPGVPLGVVAALNHAGVEIDYMEFAAASGWAFSFGYKYDDVSAAYMAVRGNPEADGPFEVFAFLPQQLGFEYEMARTAEPDVLWRFVQQHVDAGTPIMSEHMDGGLITSYREHGSQRQLFFDGTVMPGWIDVDKLNPYAVYCLVRQRDPNQRDQIQRLALERAVAKGEAHSWKGVPQGVAALSRYLFDVRDISKDFAETEEWFCWATFERLMARRCCQVWLQRTAEDLDDEARKYTAAAAERFGAAFAYYEDYRAEVGGGEPTRRSLEERARTPERISVVGDILEEGIRNETEGLSLLRQAVATFV